MIPGDVRYVVKMNGTEFIRRAKRWARKAGLEFRFDRGKGKGSHGMVYIGGRLTSVKRTEIGKGLLNAMLKDLGIEKGEF